MEAIQDFQLVNQSKQDLDELAGSVVEIDNKSSQVFVNFEIAKCYEKLNEPQLALFYLQKDLDLVFRSRVVSNKFSDDQIIRTLRQKVLCYREILTPDQRIMEEFEELLQNPVLYQKPELL